MLKLNTRDTVSLSPQFFDVIDRGEDYILLVSKFTSHKWKLVYLEHFCDTRELVHTSDSEYAILKEIICKEQWGM